MASFMDEIPQFNPYIQQQPVEAMATVGINREQAFEKGIETVNSFYSTLLNLPIAKQATQEYIKSKVGQLNKAVSQSISGDFSDRRLINQIGGLASQISNDPIVENGVQSTAKLQAGLAQMKADQEANLKLGKSPTYNIADYNDAINAWMSDGRVDTAFTGQYSPYVDVIDRALKLFKEQNPGDNIGRDAFYVDANGKTQVSPTLREGIDPKRIQGVLNLVYQQPDVQQQLAINGRQKFKNFTPEILSDVLTESTNLDLKGIEDTIRTLQLRLATDSTIDGTAATNQINQLKEQAKLIQREHSENIGLLTSGNTDALKTKLAQQEITSNFISAYSFDKMKKSPLWEATMETLKYELDLVKNGMEQEKFRFDMLEKNRRYELDFNKEQRLASGKYDANGNRIPDGGDVFSTTGNVPESSGKLGSTSFNQLYENAQSDLNQGMFGIVHDIYNQSNHEPGDFNPIKQDPATGAYTYNIDPTGVSGYKSLAEASSKYFSAFLEARGQLATGQATPMVKNAFQKVAPQTQYVQALTVRKKELDAKRDIVINEMKSQTGASNPDYIDAAIVDKKEGGWEQSLARLRQKYGADWKKGMEIITGYGGGYETHGKNYNEYQKFLKNFESNLVPKLQQVEEAYKASQLSLLPINSVLTGSTPEDKEISRTKYSNVASSVAQGNKSYGSFRDLLEPDKAGKYKANIYGATYDPLERKYYLSVTRGGEQGNKIEKIEVTREEFESIPQFKSDNAFWNKFGDILSITNKTTTDITGAGGYATSFPMNRPPTSEYQVGYHVVSVGKDLYNLKLYIKDKKGNDILNTDAGLSASPAALMQAISQFEQSDVYIKALVDTRK